MSLLDQEVFILPEHMSSGSVYPSGAHEFTPSLVGFVLFSLLFLLCSIFFSVVRRFVLFLLDIYFVLSVLLRITVSDINHLVIFLYEGVDRGREPGSKGGGKRELGGKEEEGRWVGSGNCLLPCPPPLIW